MRKYSAAFTIILCIFSACQFHSSNEAVQKSPLLDSIPSEPIDTSKTLVPIVFEEWKSRLSSIEANVNRIDTIKNWTKFFSKELEISTEGGDATFFQNDTLTEKIEVNIFGETFQEHNEYYLLNNRLSFVLVKKYVYNRPMYYDSAAMKENNDSVTFDFSKSTIQYNRFYFNNDKIVYAITPEKVDTVSAGKALTEETNRILELYNTLRQLGLSPTTQPKQ